MSDLSLPDNADAANEKAVEELAWAIEASEGRFCLLFARCNYIGLQNYIAKRLSEVCSVEIKTLVLDESDITLYGAIQTKLADEQPQALMVFGLESVLEIDRLVIAANQAREEFNKNCPYPLVLWVNDEVMGKLIRLAPDFESWGTTTQFVLDTNTLIEELRHRADNLFAKVLAADANQFLSNVAIFGSDYRLELQSALKDLQSHGQELEPALEACRQFVLGRDAYFREEIDAALAHYQQSLTFWQQEAGEQESGTTSPPEYFLERQGVLLFHIGLCHVYQAHQQRTDVRRHWEEARRDFQQCVAMFEQTQQKCLVARFISPLAEVLRHLEAWQDLQFVAQKALKLHQICGYQGKQAEDCSFLAEVELKHSHWKQANHYANRALSILTKVPEGPIQLQILYPRLLKQLCQLFLAKSQQHLKQHQQAAQLQAEAGKELETALEGSNPQYNPRYYIHFLEKLHSLYLEQGQYLEAFRIKQQQRSIEQQYGFRAFIGAGYLQPKQELISTLTQTERQAAIAQEIEASGRKHDIDRLIERIGRNDYKLTVLYGQSGVGKSSTVNAGLIPALKQRGIGTRDTLVIPMRFYNDWVQTLEKTLIEALTEQGIEESELGIEETPSTQFLLEQLQQNDGRNLLTVLIFDQFEEFFFVYTEPAKRRAFFDFLANCVEIPYVKVILSLREDYLHYLLVCNRLSNMGAINNDILSKNTLYYLGNFSPSEAKSIIQHLTDNSHFYLEPALVEQLVQELAGELGEVRPVELQVVGAQLQSENMTTLAQYQKRGPKEALVKRYLDEVVRDCGSENKEVAELVLYLLTDENNTRPLKTRPELEDGFRGLAIDLAAEVTKLDLVLEIFVQSGLVFLLPEIPTNRYQLVHDYLVSFIRQQQDGELITKLREAEDKRRLSEHKLHLFFKRAAVVSVVVASIMGVLTVFAVNFALQAKNNEITALSNSSKWLYISNRELLDPLIEALRAGIKLKKAGFLVKPDTRTQAMTALQLAFSGVRERNRLQGHNAEVNSVSFSPDGQTLATASADGTVKLWRLDGQELQTLRGHNAPVQSVVFSPDGQTLATAGYDKTVKLWSKDGKKLQTLGRYDAPVQRVVFSPDSQTLATATTNGMVKLWSRDGRELITFRAAYQSAVNSIAFSPDNKILAIAGREVKLWSRDGKELQTLWGHRDWVNSVSFSPNGQMIATASADKMVILWSRDGKKLKTLSGHQDAVNIVSFSPDGQTLATASKEVILWAANGQKLATLQGYNDWINSISFSRNGKVIATAVADGTVKLWNREERGLKTLIRPNSKIINSVSFSPDGQTIVTAGREVIMWSQDGRVLQILRGYQDLFNSASFSPDDQTIAAASWSKTVKLWSRDGKGLPPLRGHDGVVKSVTFSPDGKTIATASWDSTVKLWSRDGKELHTLKGHQNWVNSVSFSPDGQTLATASKDGTIKLWSRDGKLLYTLQKHKAAVNSVSFSPDGQTLASASSDTTVKIWSRDGKELRTFHGHSAAVESVVFSPRGQTIATASKDKTIKLWSRDGRELQTLLGHEAAVQSLNFSPDGKTLASSDLSGKVILWDLNLNLDLDVLLGHACKWVGDYLKNNPNVEQSDHHLCDGIGTQ